MAVTQKTMTLGWGPFGRCPDEQTVRWLDHDVLITRAPGSPAALVGVTWWDATSGAWGGSRVLSGDELEVVTIAVEALSSTDPATRPALVWDLAVLLDRLLDH